MTRLKLAALFFSAYLVCAAPALSQDGPQPKLKTIELTAGMHVIHTELAVTANEQMTGMMYRRGMGANEGMLFVYPDSGVRCFWMRNTLVPLTIAFLSGDGTVINFADMKPLDESSHCSDKPAQYALEVPQGWFAKRGFKPGLKLRGAPFNK
jgi:uncharacterized protein